MADDVAFLVEAVDGQDFVLEGPALGGRNGALVREVAELVQLLLGQAVLLGHHLGTHELAELDVGIALLHPRTLGNAQARLGRQHHRHTHWRAGHALDARGDHDVHGATHHRLGGELQGLLGRPALSVHRGGRHALRQLGGQHGVASDVGGLLACLRDAPHDHIFNGGRIDAGAIDQLVQHHTGKVCRMPAPDASTLASTGGARRGNNVSFGHIQPPLA